MRKFKMHTVYKFVFLVIIFLKIFLILVPESVENIAIQGSTLVWDRPRPLTCDILNYHINLSLIEKDQCQQVYRNENFNTEDAEVNLLELEPYSTYRVNISTETDAGLGPETTHEFVTPEKVPKRGPIEINITAVSATGASFAWSEIECGYKRGLIRGYKFSLQNADGQELITSETSERQWEVDNLIPFTEYIFSVKGFNSKGDGESKELSITTNESTPSVPCNLIAIVILCVVILVMFPPFIFFCRFYYSQKNKKVKHPTMISMTDYDGVKLPETTKRSNTKNENTLSNIGGQNGGGDGVATGDAAADDSAYEEPHTYMTVDSAYTNLQKKSINVTH
ncbi:receptor-type tyrosine-protein phosphatase F-like [Anneissia japonica]|uniref:receptor-type tyrosine-protein phosphatase F-like n=1 Tax=Anneissia japonica TaxID=1529436 RepID=UPI0014255A97|nr:receptor-type tyrosine-protein phosphatase F-like [Anneissia japonica]